MPHSPRILFVLTSNTVLADGRTPSGSWLEELAAAYNVLTDGGCKVTLASIAGGPAPIDPASLQEPWLTQHGTRFLADEDAQVQLRATQPIATVDGARFDAVYLVGGAAVMWDFPSNPTLAGLMAGIAARGGVLAGVCHGVAGMLNGSAGCAFAAGRRITCISDAEDIAAGYEKLVPFMPESRLREAGGEVICGAPFEAHVIVDGNMITGQNPASAAGVAQRILERLQANARILPRDAAAATG